MAAWLCAWDPQVLSRVLAIAGLLRALLYACGANLVCWQGQHVCMTECVGSRLEARLLLFEMRHTLRSTCLGFPIRPCRDRVYRIHFKAVRRSAEFFIIVVVVVVVFVVGCC